MSRFSAAPDKPTTPETADEILFKPDRPRQIDRFINFFGAADAVPANDTHSVGTALEEDDE
jgi:hypothetical protein